jgi:hypothetical protein
MASKMSLTGVVEEFNKAFKALEFETKEINKKTVTNMVDELVLKTPIDTGLARASWKTNETNTGINVENSVEYIQYLNEGSSKQAPARFIEATALKYGIPFGTIVEVKQGN